MVEMGCRHDSVQIGQFITHITSGLIPLGDRALERLRSVTRPHCCDLTDEPIQFIQGPFEVLDALRN